jgi:hypothetical protein
MYFKYINDIPVYVFITHVNCIDIHVFMSAELHKKSTSQPLCQYYDNKMQVMNCNIR